MGLNQLICTKYETLVPPTNTWFVQKPSAYITHRTKMLIHIMYEGI